MIAQEARGEISILRMEHGKANALDLELLQALDAGLAEFEQSDARALVLTGTNSIFCAGVDLFRLLADGDAYLDGFLAALNSVLTRLFVLPKPVVAAVNGHAIAGGCLLALASDQRIMAEGRGKIGVTELYVGVPFPPFALEIMRHAVAPHVAENLILTGRLCGADESLQLGLVNRIVAADNLIEEALEVARHLGSVVPATYAITKHQLRRGVVDRVAAEFAELATQVREHWRSEEVRATIRAFLDATVGKRRRP